MPDRLCIDDIFRTVDDRFGVEWPIPYEAVTTSLSALDNYWRMDSPHKYSAKSHGWTGRDRTGLAFILAPTAADYDALIRELATEYKAKRFR